MVLRNQVGQFCESSFYDGVVAGGKGKAKQNLVLFSFLKILLLHIDGSRGKSW